MSDGYFNRYMEVSLECDRLKDRISSLEHALAAAERELERWRHGNTVEGDFVCPNELEAVNLRQENAQLIEQLRAAMEDYTDAAGERNSALAQLAEVRGECDALSKVYGVASCLRMSPVPFDEHLRLVDAVDECREFYMQRMTDLTEEYGGYDMQSTSPPRSGDE